MNLHDHRRLHHRPLTPVSTVNLASTPGIALAAAADLTFNQELLSAAPSMSISRALADLALQPTEVPLMAYPQMSITAQPQLSMPLALAAAPAMTLSAGVTLAASVAIQTSVEMHISSQARLNLDNALAATPLIQMQAVVDPNPIALAATPLIQFTAAVGPNPLALNATPLMRISRQQASMALDPMAFWAAPQMTLGKQIYVRGMPIFTGASSPAPFWIAALEGPQIYNGMMATLQGYAVSEQSAQYAAWKMADGNNLSPWIGKYYPSQTAIIVRLGNSLNPEYPIRPARFRWRIPNVYSPYAHICMFAIYGCTVMDGAHPWVQLYASPFYYPPADGSEMIFEFAPPATAYGWLAIQSYAIAGNTGSAPIAVYDMAFDYQAMRAVLTV